MEEIENLFKGIWEKCPKIKTLHIDNVSPHNVNTEAGEKITEVVAKYTTAGNITPFGIESFDPIIREKCNLNGSIGDIHKSIEIINRYGKERGSNGIPKLLPGINIIYGLDGQSENTLKFNLENFNKILESGNFVRRVFVRKLTSPFGEQFDSYSNEALQEFNEWSTLIENDLIVPMLKKVFPIGLEISELRMEMYKEGNSILRQMGTCPVRVIVLNKKLNLDQFYKVKVVDYIGNRTIIGEII